MKMLHAATLAIGILVGSGSPALAQEAPGTTRDVSVLLQAKESRWHVRATLLDGGTVEGRVRNVDGSSASIGARQFAPQQIALLERRIADQTDTRRGGLIGGAAGVLFGALVAIPFCDYGNEGRCNAHVSIMLGSTFVGAMLGATAGGIFSAGETKWEPVWRR